MTVTSGTEKSCKISSSPIKAISLHLWCSAAETLQISPQDEETCTPEPIRGERERQRQRQRGIQGSDRAREGETQRETGDERERDVHSSFLHNESPVHARARQDFGASSMFHTRTEGFDPETRGSKRLRPWQLPSLLSTQPPFSVSQSKPFQNAQIYLSCRPVPKPG